MAIHIHNSLKENKIFRNKPKKRRKGPLQQNFKSLRKELEKAIKNGKISYTHELVELML